MPTSSDAFVSAFHNWLNRHANGGPFGPINTEYLQKSGPQLTRDQLLDRYETHTLHCRSCRTQLKRLKTVQAVTAVGTCTRVGDKLRVALFWLIRGRQRRPQWRWRAQR
jgi:hypothetical protein